MKVPYLNRVYALLALIMVVALVLGACAAPAKAPAPPVAAGPKYGGTITVPYLMDFSTLDPIMSTSIVDRAVVHLYGDTLITWSGKNDENPKIVPHVATSWEITPDGMTYTFHMAQGIKWQNLPPVNGRELVADDYKFSFERIMNPKTKSPLAPYLANIDHIDAPDKYTLKIFMKTPDPSMLSSLAGPSSSAFAREVIERDGDATKTIIGTGPFIWDKYTPGVGVTFKKNPDYWIKGKPYLDGVQCLFMTDAAARLAAFRTGQLARTVEGKTNADLIKSSVPGATIVPGVNLLGSCLVFNLGKTDKPWADKKVRQALQYAIDYDGLIQAVLNGQGSRTDFLNAKQYADYGARQIADLPKYDLAKAKAMLADAGYAGGFKVPILQHTNRMDAWGGAVEPLAAMFKQVGIDAQIVPSAQADYASKLRAGDFEMATSVILATQPELDSNLPPMYKTKGTYNRAQYSNARVDELLGLEAKNFANTTQRQTYVKEIMKILADEVPVIPLYYQFDSHITQPWLMGWDNSADPGTATAWQEIANVWINK
jgi:peptide/nickel transport system substrate-binding protein